MLCIDCVHAVPVRQQAIYERALQAAVKDAGNAMAPHMEAILQRSLRAMPSTQDDDAFAQQLTTSSASRMVLSIAAAELTEAQAAYAFAKVEDECSDVRIAALEVCSTAMSRFAREPHVDAILRATRDEDVLVRVAATNALVSAIGTEWAYRKARVAMTELRYLFGIAMTREKHDACKARLLTLRGDAAAEVREAVEDALMMLGYPDGSEADADAPKAKAVRREDTFELEEGADSGDESNGDDAVVDQAARVSA